MKTQKILLLVAAIGFYSIAAACTVKTDTLKVYGNCNMCKSRIEGALKKKDGISDKSWSTKTKLLIVSYDAEKISLEQIHQKVAAVGHDTEKEKASKEVYAELPECCQYERAAK